MMEEEVQIVEDGQPVKATIDGKREVTVHQSVAAAVREARRHAPPLRGNGIFQHPVDWTQEEMDFIVDSLKNNDFHFTIEDNGKGMSPEFLARVTDPYTTSRTTRKVGLGLPLIKMNTENCGGGMKLTSELGVGTRLEFWFQHNHWDRPPMGDLAGSLVMLLSAHEDIHFVITYRTDIDEFVLDTDELKEALDGMSLNDIHIINYLKEMINENLQEIQANE